MKKVEVILEGGESTATVVRIGDTVRRTIGKNATLVHNLLQHLEKVHFEFAPRFLGIDADDREILSYIEGVVPRGRKLNIEQLAACAKILRAFHDAASLSPLCGQAETICHNDFAPWNIIFKDGLPVGMIDFDDCQAGARIEDVAYFIWTFLDVGMPIIGDAEQLNNIAILAKAYKLDTNQNLAEAMLRQQERILVFRQEKALTEVDIIKRNFSAQAANDIQTAMEWVKVNYENIKNAS